MTRTRTTLAGQLTRFTQLSPDANLVALISFWCSNSRISLMLLKPACRQGSLRKINVLKIVCKQLFWSSKGLKCSSEMLLKTYVTCLEWVPLSLFVRITIKTSLSTFNLSPAYCTNVMLMIDIYAWGESRTGLTFAELTYPRNKCMLLCCSSNRLREWCL